MAAGGCVLALLLWPLSGAFTGAVLNMTGIDRIAERLARIPNVETVRDVHDSDDRMVAKALSAADRCHIVLIGFSEGGRGAVRIAKRLDQHMVPVKLLVTLDPPDRPGWVLETVPSNVEVAENFRQEMNPLLGGGKLRRSPRNRMTLLVGNDVIASPHSLVATNLAERVSATVARIAQRRWP